MEPHQASSGVNSDNIKLLIPELLKQFYKLGWVTGTGGGITIRDNSRAYIAPSGVQKERVQPDDLFIVDLDTGEKIFEPRGLKISACEPIFRIIYSRCDAGAVIHTHSRHALMATLLWSGKEFTVSHLEMIKGVYDRQLKRNLQYNETLTVPIVENTPHECELVGDVDNMITSYAGTCAVLVRRHGLYVWADTWQRAKTMCECLDYIFQVCVEMKQFGIDTKCPK